MLHGALCSAPEKLLLTPLWDNPEVTRNNKPIPTKAFRMLSHHIRIIGHLYEPGTNIMMSRQTLKKTYNIILDEASYVDLRYIVNSAFNKLEMKSRDIPMVIFPMQTL